MRDCTRCDLCKTRKHIVWGIGPQNTRIMLVGQNPGVEEDRRGRPFVGKTGKELDQLLNRIGYSRDQVYITNTVKCHTHDDEDPTEEQIQECSSWLEYEIIGVCPDIIVTLGRVATRYFLGDVDMEMVHGIPFMDYSGRGIILPAYHPAAGLHVPEVMKLVQNDFAMIPEVLAGRVQPRNGLYDDPVSKPEYELLKTGDLTHPRNHPIMQGFDEFPYNKPWIAIDTEWARNQGWCLTFSSNVGKAFMIMADNKAMLEQFNGMIKGCLVINHSSLYDIPVLESMDVDLSESQVVDTLLMAYLLQDYPQGLKALAFRIAGMKMDNYQDITREATLANALEYLFKVLDRKWDNPELVPEWDAKTDRIRLKRPWNIAKKADRIIQDYIKKDGIDPWERWHNIAPEEGREQVEKVLGPMQAGELCDIPFEKALTYSTRDSDATLRVFPHLWHEIAARGLIDVFWMDMATIPMIVDMMRFGIKALPEKFRELSGYFAQCMAEKDAKLTQLTGKVINPGSDQQVRKLLFDDLKLPPRKKTKGGEDSTGDKILAQLVPLHPVVQVIRDYRAYSKLKGTYADPMPYKIKEDGRIHPTFRITRTDTGRLSSFNPNLQAVPVKSEDGRMIRGCYVAEDGYSLASFDLKQIELRMLACEAEEPTLIRIFQNNEDVHTMTACEVFGLPPSQIDEYKHRRPCKRVNFGIPYGITATGLQETIGQEGGDITEWTENRCQELIDAWFDRFSAVKRYISEIHGFARRNGYVRDMWGRMKFIPQVHMANKYIILEGLREAQNQPIQSSSQGVIKHAMGNLTLVYKQFRSEGIDIRPLIQIHDDLLWEIPDAHLQLCIPVIAGMMENAVTLAVPTPVEPKVGKVWNELKVWEEWE